MTEHTLSAQVIVDAKSIAEAIALDLSMGAINEMPHPKAILIDFKLWGKIVRLPFVVFREGGSIFLYGYPLKKASMDSLYRFEYE